MNQPPAFSPPFRMLLLLVAAVVALFLADLSIGSVPVPFAEVWQALIGPASPGTTTQAIILKIRLPRALTAIVAGSALSVGGLLMQTLFRNPLAGPSVLGVTAGASLGVAFVMLAAGSGLTFAAFRQLGVSANWLLVLAGTVGASAVLLLMLAVAMRVRDYVVVLIVGLMVSNITLAIVSIWQYFSRPEQLQEYLLWTFGSLNGVTNQQMPVLLLATLPGYVLALLSAKPLNLLLLGERYAESSGLNLFRTRFILILATSLLAGVVTGFCGPIGFVGIAVPHLARGLFRTADHRILVPACVLCGAAVLLACDLLAQLPGTSVSLPLNAVTALMGSPVVIWVIMRK